MVRFHLYEISRIEKSLEAEFRLVGARGWREGGWGVTAYEVREFPSGGMKMFWD